jgi:hypothetical protein
MQLDVPLKNDIVVRTKYQSDDGEYLEIEVYIEV